MMACRRISSALPATGDVAAIKQRLLDAAERVLADYRDEFERQTLELRKASASSAGGDVHAHVHLRFLPASVEAVVRYPVPLPRAAEVEERMTRELFAVLREA